MGKKRNMGALMRALEADLHKDPVRFFKTVVMPLLPKEAKVEMGNDGIVMWRNLLGQDVRAEDVGDGNRVGAVCSADAPRRLEE
jgi:hypothetical protein